MAAAVTPMMNSPGNTSRFLVSFLGIFMLVSLVLRFVTQDPLRGRRAKRGVMS